ncbi:hypothetical protein [Candidatus Igneacidithiobacillus taiwanensis]|nr:hypothetical protein [Candidatus Igneacidithiobacillus taiwanensis]
MKKATPPERNAATTQPKKFSTLHRLKNMLAHWMPVLLEVLRP